MRKLLRNIIHHTYRPWLQRYLSKERKYSYRGIRLSVKPGVFHPGFFYSTKIMLDFLLSKESIGSKKVLELGCGAGLIAIATAVRGAKVTATDINTLACENTLENSHNNGVMMEVLQSDLFENIPIRQFDLIVINPPYYAKDPIRMHEYAWNCGSDFGYFKRLFQQIADYLLDTSEIYMVLSNECDLDRIKAIAAVNNFDMKVGHQSRKGLEWIYIFEVKSRK